MSDDLLGAPGDLQPAVTLNFNLPASLARTMSQPVIVDEPAGLVVFGNTSEIFLAEVSSTGASVYSRRNSIKANTYIHGWTVSVGKLYVLDGVELSAWDIGTGQKGQTIELIKNTTKVAQAKDALADLQKFIQRVEWATLLEQAEDEWVRLTAQQSAAAPLSEERDRLDTLASDYFRMLKTLREMTGSTGGGSAARRLVATLRQELADKRKAVAPWCFSAPVVRRHSFDEPLRAIFTIQGDGTIHACDKPLTQLSSKKWRQQAELSIGLMEDLQPQMFVYIADNALRTVDIATLAEKGSWSPETPVPAGGKHTLAWANKQLWWSTEAGVYACKVDAAGNFTPTFKSGPAWSTRQVGRLNAPPTPYDPPVNPNHLFESMNIGNWIAQRTNPSAPLTDGMTAHLMMSDEAGKYTTAAEGVSYIVHGPFAGDARSQASGWTQIKAHAGKPLVILSDSRGASMLCRYPTPGGVSQLVPQWSVLPWLSSVAVHSPLDLELSREWPTPAVKPLSKPLPDMVAHLKSSTMGSAANTFENLLSMYGRKLTDRDVRLLLWYALYNRPFPSNFFFTTSELIKDQRKFLNLFFNDSEQLLLKNRFGHQPAVAWDLTPQDNNSFLSRFTAKRPPVDFDPPWQWKTPPANLFHGAPPVWYDPWGYNRPADFFPGQANVNYLTPFCFDGLLPFPQRTITLEGTFKGRSWSMFTDNDPVSILANAKPATKETAREDPVLLQASGDPTTLVVTADEDRQRTNFQLLEPKQARITFDAYNHRFIQDTTALGSTGIDVMASPTVYKKQGKTFPTAWCVVNPEFASARLRKLAAVDQTGGSLWTKFIDDNKTQYGPATGSKTWQIEKCPLPQTALPIIWLYGYNLPASS